MEQEELEYLLSRCVLRDRSAFQLLYGKTSGYLNAVAYKIVGSSDASHDVLQEAFVQIWENASTYHSTQASVLTWMVSIVRYRALDRLKMDKRNLQRYAYDVQEVIDSTPSNHCEEEQYSKIQMNARVAKCLQAMNDNFSKSVELAYVYGYSRDELAEKFQTNVNTVKSWLRRGASKLRLCLENNLRSSHE